MYKKVITFKDFDDNDRTETHYFNLSKVEMIELEVGAEGGSFGAWARGIVDTQDPAILIEEFKKLILDSYGKKSPDGSSFEKSEEISKAFSHTAAFVAMFTELATDEAAAADFVNGLVPAEMREEVAAAGKAAVKRAQAEGSIPETPSA